MSWISKEHKILYSNAFNALVKDVKAASTSLLNTTGEILTNGYEKIKESEYIGNYYKTDKNSDNKNNDEEENKDQDEQIENIIIDEKYPDVLVEFNRKYNNISKIWIFDNKRNKIRVSGKISSYQYINEIIHKWFIYEKSNKDDDRYKWYPTEELYTICRGNTRILNPIDNIIFKYQINKYVPHHYVPH